jgi:hypothetical protein
MMRHPNRTAFRRQVNFLRRQFLQDGDLPFTNVLTEEVIAQALTAFIGGLDRIFPPLVTMWVFLGQVLSADLWVLKTRFGGRMNTGPPGKRRGGLPPVGPRDRY